MDIKEILGILKIDSLDESTTNAFSEALRELVEANSKEIATALIDPIVEETKKTLKEEYEVEFEKYKESVNSQWSTFVDSVIDDVLVIPENVKEFARRGQLYGPIIDQLKVRVGIDEGALTKEATSLLSEAKEELTLKESEINDLQDKYLSTFEDNKNLTSQLYIRDLCEGLSEVNRIKAISLLKNEREKDIIDERFETLKTVLFNEEEEQKDNVNESEDKNKDGSGHKEVLNEKKEDKEPIKESYFDAFQNNVINSLRKNA